MSNAVGAGGATTAGRKDKLGQVKGKADAVKAILQENLAVAAGNKDRLKEMEAKAEDLEENAKEFQKESAHKKSELWYRACRLWVILWAIAAALALVIAVTVYAYIKQSDIEYHERMREYQQDTMQLYWPF